MRVLKLGGSVLTDKSRPRTPRPRAMEHLARELHGHAGGLVLVHGGGSCGHDSAARFGLAGGLAPGAEPGLFVVHREVARLCEMMCDRLQVAGVAALPLHPLDLALTAAGRIESFNLQPVRACIERGVLPVLHGDVTFDTRQAAAILSGDQLVVHLAVELGACEVGIGTDVDGVLDSEGRVIPRITPATFPEVRGLLGSSSHVDVTGGMLGKVEELCTLARRGIPSTIFNAAREGSVRSFLACRPQGTRVTGDESPG